MEGMTSTSLLDYLRRRLFPSRYKEEQEARKKKQREQARQQELMAQEQLRLQQEQHRLAQERDIQQRLRREVQEKRIHDVWGSLEKAGRTARQEEEVLKESKKLDHKPRLKQGPRMRM